MRRRRQFSAGFQHFHNFGVLRRPVHGRYVRPWNPLLLTSLRAWYDAERGQPKYGGAGAYVQLDGTSGDYIFTPDSAATSFSNDIEVVMRVKVTDWTAAANQTLAGKYVSTGNQRSWRFYVNTSGAIGLTASTDGTAVTSVIVTPTNALPDATWIWLRMRLDLTNGSNSVGTLETATDTGDNTEPSSWTANGTNTGTTISGIFDSTAPTEIGTFGSGTLERMTGQVGRCIVRSGFGGTTVADFNASDCYGNGYWHSGGYQWTLGLPKIYDRSANNRAPATFGSGSNQPRWLRWTGTSCVHLESASSGTNSISCTAPSGAASYVARSRDYPNVADDTGAAAAGAFAFTTAGQWQYISILNGSAVEIARFDASLCSQTGMTDSYSVAWTVNRGTAGRKTVVQSPAARSARSVILHGTDDWIDVPAAAVPALDTFAAATSVVAAYRRWHNPGASGHAIFTTKANFANTALGFNIRLNLTAANTQDTANAGDGAANDAAAGAAVALGARSVATLRIGNASPFMALAINDGAVATDTSRTSTGTTSTGGVGRIGAYTGGTGAIDMEFETLICRDTGGTDTEHGLQVAYLGGGL